MTDFSHLRLYDVASDDTAELELCQLEGSPVLVVAPATDTNRGYFNALLKRNKTYARRLKAGGVTPELLSKNRNEDRVLYARFVLKGWKGVVDSAGASVDFNVENATAFLKALPDWIFDDVRSFAAEPSSFVADGDPTPDDIEEAAGN